MSIASFPNICSDGRRTNVRCQEPPDGETAYCPKCEEDRAFKKYEFAARRQSWTCTACGHHIHPTAGTIFEKSSTSLQLWFYAMYLMTSTRCGISAKQLERELGVKYKTAWRMFNKIRTHLMADDGEPLSGHVEADETLLGGRIRNDARRKREALGWSPKRWDTETKTMVFAAAERDGRVRARVIPNSSGPTLRNIVRENIEPGSVLYTDEWGGYLTLADSYDHRTIRHRDRIYVDGTTHTQTVEGFFALSKNAIRGVHHGVSNRWLQGYLNEYAWRYNRRGHRNSMFRDLVETAATTTV
ncbi:MAG TPA: IS1595 family transposase [Gaiellaceae bacterium]|nr:IS1595 family transposase [Gaiellaceae bacterium]